MKKYRFQKYLILAIAFLAICWDLSVSNMDVEPGTYRLESEFDAVSGATTSVGIVTSDYSELSDPISRTTNPTYTQIEAMVGKAIELQGGFEGVINKGDKVMIKVNLVGGNSSSGEGENTDVRVVKALVKQIANFTESDVVIQIAEGTARTNDDITDPESVWGRSGYIDLLTDSDLTGINLSLLNLNQTVNDLIEVDLGSEGTSAPQSTKYHVHKAELEADVYIVVPVLKIHDTGITNALKLQIGSAPGCYYGYNKMTGTSLSHGLYHDVDHRVWTTEAIVDLCNIADIDFVVVDAIMCLESEKVNKGYNQVRFNTILAGWDPVAVDHVSAQLMGLNPDDVAHITLAEKLGLGTNNPDKIKVEGVPIAQAMKKVKKSQAADGKFGQSNRTWILTQAYDETDISKEIIANEAALQPKPGENGWSQPVYFFDDRIDLLSYYSGKTDMISYAYTNFKALKDQQAELWLGTHEAIYVYLNGVLEYSFTSTSSYGDSDRGELKKKINIKKGNNTLLVKTLNKFGDYTFALNICELESDPLYFGNRVAGLKFYQEEGSGVNNIANANQGVKSLLSIYPNPAKISANIGFELFEESKGAIKIFDLSGKLIRTFQTEILSPGVHQIIWDLNDNSGQRVKKGVYICTITLENQISNSKLLVE